MSDSRVQNYYEPLVFAEVERQLDVNKKYIGEDKFSDISCIALNKLPAKYVRFTIDTTFYSTPEELKKINNDVASAVTKAMKFILK